MAESYKITLCTRYRCKDLDCKGLHLCHYYLTKNCGYENHCQASHSLCDQHNSEVLREAGCPEITIHQVKQAYFQAKGQYPTICTYYNNVKEGCSRKNSCHFLHICSHYVTGDCQFGKLCQLSHNILDQQVKNCLDNYGMGIKCLGEEVHIVEVLRKYAGYSVILNVEKKYNNLNERQEESLENEVNNNSKSKIEQDNIDLQERYDINESNVQLNKLKNINGSEDDDDLEEGEICDDKDERSNNESMDDGKSTSEKTAFCNTIFPLSGRIEDKSNINSFGSENHTPALSGTTFDVNKIQSKTDYSPSVLFSDSFVQPIQSPFLTLPQVMDGMDQQTIPGSILSNQMSHEHQKTNFYFYQQFSNLHQNCPPMPALNVPNYIIQDNSVDASVIGSQHVPSLDADRMWLTSNGTWQNTSANSFNSETIPGPPNAFMNNFKPTLKHMESDMIQTTPVSTQHQHYDGMHQVLISPHAQFFNDNFSSSGANFTNGSSEYFEPHKESIYRESGDDQEVCSLFPNDVDMRPKRSTCDIEKMFGDRTPPLPHLPLPPTLYKYSSQSLKRSKLNEQKLEKNKVKHSSNRRRNSHKDHKSRRKSHHHRDRKQRNVEQKKEKKY